MDDEVAELLGFAEKPERKLPIQPTRAQKVAAFEQSMARRQQLEDFIGKPLDKPVSERNMVRAQAQWIDAVQREQMRVPIQASVKVNPQLAVYQQAWRDIEAYQAEQDRQKRQQQQDAVMAAAAEVVKALGVPFEEAARAIAAVFRDASDAMIAAMRPLLDLLDQSESFPSQPTCPSHAIALRGGRCPRCDRRMNRHPRR